MKRILLFLATNLAVMLVLTVVARLLGIDRYLASQGGNLGGLLAFAALFGFGGALISLAMSKWMAKRAMGVRASPLRQCNRGMAGAHRARPGGAGGYAMPGRRLRVAASVLRHRRPPRQRAGRQHRLLRSSRTRSRPCWANTHVTMAMR
jgi:Zn-dependent protease with chaperone function